MVPLTEAEVEVITVAVSWVEARGTRDNSKIVTTENDRHSVFDLFICFFKSLITFLVF